MSTNPISQNRREFLKLTSKGVSGLALSSLLNSNSFAAPKPKLHHTPKAKSVILLYMSGGVSHVDSFDPKPLLKKHHGKPMPMPIERTQFDANGNLMASPWESKPYGESGLELTNMFPKIAERADDLAICRSMTAKFSEHAQGNFFMHTGFPFLGYPSAGSWINYGLGTENPNLPGYVVLQSQRAKTPHGGVSPVSARRVEPEPQVAVGHKTDDAFPSDLTFVDVFQLNKSLDTCYRIPLITYTAAGTLLAIAEERFDAKNCPVSSHSVSPSGVAPSFLRRLDIRTIIRLARRVGTIRCSAGRQTWVSGRPVPHLPERMLSGVSVASQGAHGGRFRGRWGA